MKALILVDFEKEWTNKDSDYFVGDISDVIGRANRLIAFCRKEGYKIILTRHVEKDSNDAFAPDSDNVGIIADIDKKYSDIIITKHKISPFFRTDLEKELEGIEEIVACGILTNLCVRSLVQDAYDRDFKITVIKDCCVAMDKEVQEFTFKDLKDTREEIEFFNLDEFIGTLKVT
ncbi:MAG: isochorismatase family cysteine hydrolase [Candidatus Woesearchaeota archaeon]